MMKIRRFYMATIDKEGVSKLRMDANWSGKKKKKREKMTHCLESLILMLNVRVIIDV